MRKTKIETDRKTAEDLLTKAILSVPNFKGDYSQIALILADKLVATLNSQSDLLEAAEEVLEEDCSWCKSHGVKLCDDCTKSKLKAAVEMAKGGWV